MIKIEGLSKFFRTEEVETIALNNVSLEVKDGEFVAIIGTFRMWQIYIAEYLGAAGQSDFGRLLPGRQGSRASQGEGAYAGPQRQHRFRVPEFQPDRRTERVRKRGTPAYLPESKSRRA